jgi:hypothetical protein
MRQNTTKTITLESIGLNGLLKLAQLRAADHGDTFNISFDAGRWAVTFGQSRSSAKPEYHNSLKSALASALADEPMFAAPMASGAVM